MRPKSLLQLSCQIRSGNADSVLVWLTGELLLEAAIEEKAAALPCCKIYLKSKSEVNSIKRKLLQSSSFSFSNFCVAKIAHDQWANRWKKGLKILKISKKLVICPSWIPYKNHPKEKIVRLDPQMAFGTGHHPTTHTCLEWLVEYASSLKTICDAGCGSGILAISAITLGIKHAFAFDIDQEAVKAAKKNARLNHASNKIRFLVCDLDHLKEKSTFDAVFANLTSLDIQKNFDKLTSLVRSPNGALILAGIEQSQTEEFQVWLQSQKLWTITQTKYDSGWKGYILKKQSGVKG